MSESVIKVEINKLQSNFGDLGVSKEAFLKESSFAMQAIQANPALMKCTPISIQTAVFNLALTGLTLNPALDYAYLVPRGGKCVLDISYKGFVYIATLSGGIKSVHAECIYEGDEFDAEEGTNPHIYHKPDYFGKREVFLGVYCVATLADGTKKHEIMNDADIEKCRSISAMKSGGIWKIWTDEMRKKTVIRRARKLWPHCEKLAKAVEIQNEYDGFEPIRQLKPTVPMPKALNAELPPEDDVPDPPLPEDPRKKTKKTKPKSDKTESSEALMVEISDWREQITDEEFDKLKKDHFPKLMNYPGDFGSESLSAFVKILKTYVESKSK